GQDTCSSYDRAASSPGSVEHPELAILADVQTVVEERPDSRQRGDRPEGCGPGAYAQAEGAVGRFPCEARQKQIRRDEAAEDRVPPNPPPDIQPVSGRIYVLQSHGRPVHRPSIGVRPSGHERGPRGSQPDPATGSGPARSALRYQA